MGPAVLALALVGIPRAPARGVPPEGAPRWRPSLSVAVGVGLLVVVLAALSGHGGTRWPYCWVLGLPRPTATTPGRLRLPSTSRCGGCWAASSSRACTSSSRTGGSRPRVRRAGGGGRPDGNRRAARGVHGRVPRRRLHLGRRDRTSATAARPGPTPCATRRARDCGAASADRRPRPSRRGGPADGGPCPCPTPPPFPAPRRLAGRATSRASAPSPSSPADVTRPASAGGGARWEPTWGSFLAPTRDPGSPWRRRPGRHLLDRPGSRSPRARRGGDRRRSRPDGPAPATCRCASSTGGPIPDGVMPVGTRFGLDADGGPIDYVVWRALLIDDPTPRRRWRPSLRLVAEHLDHHHRGLAGGDSAAPQALDNPAGVPARPTGGRRSLADHAFALPLPAQAVPGERDHRARAPLAMDTANARRGATGWTGLADPGAEACSPRACATRRSRSWSRACGSPPRDLRPGVPARRLWSDADVAIPPRPAPDRRARLGAGTEPGDDRAARRAGLRPLRAISRDGARTPTTRHCPRRSTSRPDRNCTKAGTACTGGVEQLRQAAVRARPTDRRCPRARTVKPRAVRNSRHCACGLRLMCVGSSKPIHRRPARRPPRPAGSGITTRAWPPGRRTRRQVARVSTAMASSRCSETWMAVSAPNDADGEPPDRW